MSCPTGIGLGVELSEGDAWPRPPQPCGVIAGTRALAFTNPTSWITQSFGLLTGAGPTSRLSVIGMNRSVDLIP